MGRCLHRKDFTPICTTASSSTVFGQIWGRFGADLGQVWGRFGADLDAQETPSSSTSLVQSGKGCLCFPA